MENNRCIYNYKKKINKIKNIHYQEEFFQLIFTKENNIKCNIIQLKR